MHSDKHGINDSNKHTGIPAGVADHIVSIDANGLPKDSGIPIIGAGPILVSLFDGTNPYVQKDGLFYTVRARFIFPGTNVVGSKSVAKAIAWVNAGSSKVKIYDLTNAATIAEKTGINSTTVGGLVDLGAISNLPAGSATFEIQLEASGSVGDHIRCSGVGLW